MTAKSGVIASTVVLGSLILCSWPQAQSIKIQAQHLLESAVNKNADIAGLEISATPVGKTTCVTIAATEAKDLEEKCDDDEFAALKSGKPHVEKEADGYDVTAPLHDSHGKLVGTIGIDFKLRSDQTDASILKRTGELLKELEQQIRSKEYLFQPVPGRG
jgi:hypothetical protein